jgi:MATE family multidrug resistance protein
LSQDGTQPDTSVDARAEKHPLAEMLFIAAPTVVTMTSYTVMQFIDGLMVSRIPRDADTLEAPFVAAQGNGGIVVWLGVSLLLGTTSVINSFVSQNLGAGKPERGAAYAWAGIWMSIVWGFVLAATIPLMPWMFAQMDHAEQLIELETAYAQILILGMGPLLASRALSHYFFGLHKPMVVMVSALIAQVVNVTANAVLIYGQAGPPEGTPLAGVFGSIAGALGVEPMGIEGAALGSLLGAVVEFIIPMALFLSGPIHRKYKTRGAFRPPWKIYKDIIRVGWPGGAMFFNELVCWGYLMAVLLAKAGEAMGESPELHNEAGWISLRYMHLSFMPAVGVSIAVQAVVGKCMGMKRPDLAAKRAWLGLGVACAYMGTCAIAFVLFRDPMVRLFVDSTQLSPEEVEKLVGIGALVMIAAAIFQVFDAIAITLSAALRGAGDTVWPGVVNLVSAWTCVVLGGHLMIRYFPHLGSLGPWIATAAFIIALAIALLIRFMRGKWRSMSLVEHPVPGGPSPAGEARTAAPALDREKDLPHTPDL